MGNIAGREDCQRKIIKLLFTFVIPFQKAHPIIMCTNDLSTSFGIRASVLSFSLGFTAARWNFRRLRRTFAILEYQPRFQAPAISIPGSLFRLCCKEREPGIGTDLARFVQKADRPTSIRGVTGDPRPPPPHIVV